MAKIIRRKFIERMLIAGTGVTMLGGAGQFLYACKPAKRNLEKLKVFIPMPLQVVIDDVGWWSGEDGSTRQEPYRTGINRNHVPAAFRHSFGPSSGRDESLSEILKKWGVDYINTPFSSMHNREGVQYEHFGFDSGVISFMY